MKQLRKPPPYCQGFIDRYENPRWYLRKPGFPRVPLPGLPWSPEFMAAYQKALEGDKVEVAGSKTIPGTMADLIVRYYRSPEFLGLAQTSREVYRRQLDKFRAEHGDKRVAKLEREHVKKMIGKMHDRPNAANNFLKRLKVLMKFALDIGMTKADPTLGMKGYKVQSEGFHTWTEDEIAKFETTHPIGSRARLAMTLMLYTGQRRSDVVKMGWQHINGDKIKVRHQKTGTLLEIPIHPTLRAVLDQTPKENMTFLMTGQGKPFSGKGFGNWVREICDEAGLPDCSSHGLRKAMSRRLAEAGCTNQQIKAITGHQTESEVSRYTKAAEQKSLAGQAMEAIGRTESRT